MYNKYIKRILDVICSIILLPIVVPLIVVSGIAIKIEDGQKIFHISSRLGRYGNNFSMYKLRTMKMNAPDIRNEDGSTFNSEFDPRLTKVGRILRKTSLDELPQVFNVLRGDMSFIGPRPDLPEHIHQYEGDEGRKLEVLPGLSGYNQAYFRNSIDWKHRLKNDIYYVERISFLFDLKIVIRTIYSIFFRKGIFLGSEVGNNEGVRKSGSG